jgi:hypothetical protein
MTKVKNLFEEKIKKDKEVHEELFNKEMDGLNRMIKSEKYNIDLLLSKTSIGHAYHDLIDSKDKLNSEYQSKFNQTYHSLDVKLYQLNKKIDNKNRMLNYNFNNKKEKVVDKVLMKIM